MYPHQVRSSQGSPAVFPHTREWNPVSVQTPTGSNLSIGTSTATAHHPKTYPPPYPYGMYPSSTIPQSHPFPEPMSNCTVVPPGPSSHGMASPMYPYSSDSICQLNAPNQPNHTRPPKSAYPYNSQYPVSCQSLLTSQYTQGQSYSNAQCIAGTTYTVPAYSRGSQCVQSKSSCMGVTGVPNTIAASGWDPYQQKGACSPTYQMTKRSAQDTPGTDIPPAKKICHDTNGQPYSVQLNGIGEGMHIQGQYYLTVSSTPEFQSDISTRNQLASAQKYNNVNKQVPPQYVQGHLAMSLTPVRLSPQQDAGVQEEPKAVDVKKCQRLVFSAINLVAKYVPKVMAAVRAVRMKYSVLCLSGPVIEHLLSIVKSEDEIKVLNLYLQNKRAVCRIANRANDCPICRRDMACEQYTYNKTEKPTNTSFNSAASASNRMFPLPPKSSSVGGVTSGGQLLPALEADVGKPGNATGHMPNRQCSTYAAPNQMYADSNAMSYAKAEDTGHSDSPDITSTFLSESEFRDQPFDSTNKVTIDPCKDDSQTSEVRYPQKGTQNLSLTNTDSSESSGADVFRFVSRVCDVQRSLKPNMNPPQNYVPSAQSLTPLMNHPQHSPVRNLEPSQNTVPSNQSFIPQMNNVQRSPETNLHPPQNSVSGTHGFTPQMNHSQRLPVTNLNSSQNTVPSNQCFDPQMNPLQRSPTTTLNLPQNSISSAHGYTPPMNHSHPPPVTNLNPSQNTVPNNQGFIPQMNHLQRSPETNLSLPQKSVPHMRSLRSALNHVQRPPVTNIKPQNGSYLDTPRFLPPQNQFPYPQPDVRCSVPSTWPAPRMPSLKNVPTNRNVSSGRPTQHSGESGNLVKYSHPKEGTTFPKTADKAFRQQAASIMKLPETVGDQKPLKRESGMFSCFSLKPSDRNETPLREQDPEPSPKEVAPGMLLPHRVKPECIVINDSDDDEPVGDVESLGMEKKPTLLTTRTNSVDNSEAGNGDCRGQTAGPDTCTNDTSCKPISESSEVCTNKISGKVESADTRLSTDTPADQAVLQGSEIRAHNATDPLGSRDSEPSADNTTVEVITRASLTSTDNAGSTEKNIALQLCQESSSSPVNQDSGNANGDNATEDSDNRPQTVEESDTIPLSEALKQLDSTSLDAMVAEGEATFATFVFNEGTGDLEITTAEFGEEEWKELMRE